MRAMVWDPHLFISIYLTLFQIDSNPPTKLQQ